MTPIYVLHCAELPERTNQCREHLAERGVDATFWRSIHGRSWGLHTDKQFSPGESIPPGHVGLNLGFWNLCQHLLFSNESDRDGEQRPDDAFVILEDDAVVPHIFQSVLTDLQITLRYSFSDWDLVFLGLAQTEPHVWMNITERIGPPNSRLCRMTDPFGTHALMVRRRALPIILDNMAVAHRNLDQQLWERVLKEDKLKWCAVLPSIVTQRTFDYTNSGKPEWPPSTINPGDPAPIPAMAGKEHEMPAILGHTPAYTPPTAETYQESIRLVDPFPCIYRGEGTSEPGFVGIVGTTRRRSIPVSQCARLNKPCHTNVEAGLVTQYDEGIQGERGVIGCQGCSLRTEMSTDAPRDKLPLPEGHFNPSMAMWRGRLVLATRDSWGHSKVALWHLDNDKDDWTGKWTVSAIGSFASNHLAAPRLEDPRLFVSPDDNGEQSLCVMFNLPDGYPPKRVQVGYLRFSPDLTAVTDTQVYRSPHHNLYEKNWVPFADEHGLHWVYATKPEHVILGDTQAHRTPNPLPWTGGVIRGGACPVKIRGNPMINERPMRSLVPLPEVYYHFFHGCLKRVQGSVYTIGCTVFDAKPPYRVLRQTATPLAWPDLPAANEDVVKRYVLWPGGAVMRAGAWHIACGIDDTNCRILRFPFKQVEDALTDVPEAGAGVSLRDTPLAKGTNS